MKLIFALIFTFLAVSAFAEEEAEWVEIDWAKVVPIEETPGFWDGRDFKPTYSPENVRTGRITGGAVVTPHAHPYQAGLLMTTSGGGTGLCGGSAISNRVILTAAHCISGTVRTQVILGAHQITSNEANQQRRTVEASGYRVHAQFNRQNLQNDIATMILPTAVTFNQFVSQSWLPALGNTESYAGLTGQVTGWGRTTEGSSASSPLLRSVQNPIITNAVCQQSLPGRIIFDSVICMAGTGGRSPCAGDSGGPLTILRNGGRVQVGVVMFAGAQSCHQGLPAGFARITSFRQWIVNNST